MSVAVMTHPRRLSLANDLANSLQCDAHVLVDNQPDRSPSPLRAAIAAWSHCPGNAIHHMVLQDDIEPAADFLELALDAACRHPDSLISLYANSVSWNGAAARIALLAGYQWITPPAKDYFPTLATIMPCYIAHRFAEYASSLADVERDDDVVLARFAAEYGYKTALRTPNLVEHDDHPSLAGHDHQGVRRSVAFQGEHSWSGDAQHLASFSALPAFLQRYARVRVPTGPLGAHWHTLTKPQHIQLVGANWPKICAVAEEAMQAMSNVPERVASARRLFRQLYLAGFSLGWAVGTICREQGSVPLRGPWRDLALRRYIEAGFGLDYVLIKWVDQIEDLMEFCTAAVTAGEVAAVGKSAIRSI